MSHALDAGFKREDPVDQQIISRISLPAPILTSYRSCSPPPALNKLNPYRDDGKICLLFYTDPNQFFRLWLEGMKQQTENQIRKKKKVG